MLADVNRKLNELHRGGKITYSASFLNEYDVAEVFRDVF